MADLFQILVGSLRTMRSQSATAAAISGFKSS